MNDKLSYLVILKDSESFDLQVLADAVSRGLGIPRFDVATKIKRFWGILHNTPMIEQANQLKESLKQEGVETFVLSSAELKAVPRPKTLKKVSLQPWGLAFQEEGKDGLLLWENVLLLCAGKIEESMSVKETLPPDGKVKKWVARTGISMTTVIAISRERAKKREVTKEKIDWTYCLDLVAGEGVESVRILGNSFDYSCLGDRMAYNVIINFKNLALDIARYLPNVIRNQGMRSMEEETVVKEVKYTNMHEYENEKTWLMQLTRRTL